jgi:hypothetical protein
VLPLLRVEGLRSWSFVWRRRRLPGRPAALDELPQPLQAILVNLGPLPRGKPDGALDEPLAGGEFRASARVLWFWFHALDCTSENESQKPLAQPLFLNHNNSTENALTKERLANISDSFRAVVMNGKDNGRSLNREIKQA